MHMYKYKLYHREVGHLYHIFVIMKHKHQVLVLIIHICMHFGATGCNYGIQFSRSLDPAHEFCRLNELTE